MADKGFDVWLGNNRGNTYSRKPDKYNNPSEFEYWDFVLDHLAEYDLPAMINYAKETSRSKTLHYIGHSQASIPILFRSDFERAELNQMSSSFICVE